MATPHGSPSARARATVLRRLAAPLELDEPGGHGAPSTMFRRFERSVLGCAHGPANRAWTCAGSLARARPGWRLRAIRLEMRQR